MQDGVAYAFQFGDILTRKYAEFSEAEKADYLTAMSWSLELSTHTMETIQPDDDLYSRLADLFSLYSFIPSSGINEMPKEEFLNTLKVWVSDLEYIHERMEDTELASLDEAELTAFWEMMLSNLQSKDAELTEYKLSF
ncbi:hypothetical protein ACQCVK_14625 [Rossellomorea vietnamensis]|uniref:hypothetical protein n=1 Tax=Rossellomorea vietnamensis TaxID=218284 RepID=UPI003CEFD18D